MTETPRLDWSDFPTVVFTIVTRNHFHFAAALADNVQQHSPDCLFVAVIADMDATTAPTEASGQSTWFHPQHGDWAACEGQIHNNRIVLSGQSVCQESWERFAFQYSAFELTCALKSQAGTWLLEQGITKLVYLDADVRLYQPAELLLQEVTDGGLLLTPHLRSRLPDDGRYPDNVDLLRTGNFNAGIWAVCSTRETHHEVMKVMHWWRACCFHQCIVDPHDGLFVDQKWLDQAVSISSRVIVSRNPGINVGYWNLHEYRPESEPLVAFHFSGADGRELRLSSHQNRHLVTRGSWLESLLNDYSQGNQLQFPDYYQALDYRYETLVDGQEIEPAWREVIRSNTADQWDLIDNPFEHFANDIGHERLHEYAEQLKQGRFHWQQAQLHQRIQTLRRKLDRQPLRRLLKFVKDRMRRA